MTKQMTQKAIEIRNRWIEEDVKKYGKETVEKFSNCPELVSVYNTLAQMEANERA